MNFVLHKIAIQNMIDITKIMNNARQLKALIGLSKGEYEFLLPSFKKAFDEFKDAEFIKKWGERKRAKGGGIKGKLDSIEKKLFFTLFYLKTYPTFDVLGSFFDLARSKAHKNVHLLSKVLQLALDKHNALPACKINSVEDMKKVFGEGNKLIIDATERPHFRHKNQSLQKQHYSGKKRRNTKKNTIIANEKKRVMFLGKTVPGKKHDFNLLKEDFDVDLNLFAKSDLLVDLGYVGIKKDYKANEILIPHKKPRTSKKNPNPTLTQEQKEENKQMSKIRVAVENSLAGVKRLGIVYQVFRNKTNQFCDLVMCLACGVWNFHLDFLS